MNKYIDELVVIEARKMAWNGIKIIDIIKNLKLNEYPKSTVYDFIKGTTFKHILDPIGFDKKLLKVKTCSICNDIKNIDCFKKGFICKICFSKQVKEYKQTEEFITKRKEKYNKNKEKELKQMKEYRTKNPDYFREKAKEYYNKNKEKINEKRREFFKTEKGKEIQRDKTKKKYYKNKYKMDQIFYRRISSQIKGVLNKGIPGSLIYVEYNKKELYEHLILTKPENIDIKDCHIDHIKPICSFNPVKLGDPMSNEFKECFSLLNLRLLSQEDNNKKSKIDRTLKWVEKVLPC